MSNGKLFDAAQLEKSWADIIEEEEELERARQSSVDESSSPPASEDLPLQKPVATQSSQRSKWANVTMATDSSVPNRSYASVLRGFETKGPLNKDDRRGDLGHGSRNHREWREQDALPSNRHDATKLDARRQTSSNKPVVVHQRRPSTSSDDSSDDEHSRKTTVIYWKNPPDTANRSIPVEDVPHPKIEKQPPITLETKMTPESQAASIQRWHTYAEELAKTESAAEANRRTAVSTDTVKGNVDAQAQVNTKIQGEATLQPPTSLATALETSCKISDEQTPAKSEHPKSSVPAVVDWAALDDSSLTNGSDADMSHDSADTHAVRHVPHPGADASSRWQAFAHSLATDPDTSSQAEPKAAPVAINQPISSLSEQASESWTSHDTSSSKSSSTDVPIVNESRWDHKPEQKQAHVTHKTKPREKQPRGPTQRNGRTKPSPDPKTSELEDPTKTQPPRQRPRIQMGMQFKLMEKAVARAARDSQQASQAEKNVESGT